MGLSSSPRHRRLYPPADSSSGNPPAKSPPVCPGRCGEQLPDPGRATPRPPARSLPTLRPARQSPEPVPKLVAASFSRLTKKWAFAHSAVGPKQHIISDFQRHNKGVPTRRCPKKRRPTPVGRRHWISPSQKERKRTGGRLRRRPFTFQNFLTCGRRERFFYHLFYRLRCFSQ